MRVCFVKLWHPPAITAPEDLVEWDVTRRGLAAALVARGHDVTIVQEFSRAARLERDGVVWDLVPPTTLTHASRRALGLAGPGAAAVLGLVPAVLAPIARARPDVIHSFDLVFYPSLALIGRLADRLGVPLVAHFHGGAPARNPALRLVERHALAHVRRLLFTTRTRGEEWVRSGALPDASRITEVFETSTLLRPGDRVAARRRTGIVGDPVYLCVGRLDPVKDPLTTIEGFARIVRARTGSATRPGSASRPGSHSPSSGPRLVLAWTDAPMLSAVQERIRALGLVDRVDLRGNVPHAEMQDLYDSADYLLQASVREVCGVAVLEALATGVVPIVTDIPPFRRLTDDGRQGRLFPLGDPVALAAQALALDPAERPIQAAAARAWFDANLSFAALAEAIEGVYQSVRGA